MISELSDTLLCAYIMREYTCTYLGLITYVNNNNPRVSCVVAGYIRDPL